MRVARTTAALVAVLVGMLSSAPVAAQNYIGAERCRACHEFEFQVWERSAHARAQQALTEEQRQDPKCNTCHTMAAETGTETTAIECERCHGPGKYYHPRYVMRDRELARAVWLVDTQPQHCMQCHTEGTPSIRPFAYEQMWAKIDHSKRAREAWEKSKATQPAVPGAPASPPAPLGRGK